MPPNYNHYQTILASQLSSGGKSVSLYLSIHQTSTLQSRVSFGSLMSFGNDVQVVHYHVRLSRIFWPLFLIFSYFIATNPTMFFLLITSHIWVCECISLIILTCQSIFLIMNLKWNFWSSFLGLISCGSIQSGIDRIWYQRCVWVT